MNKKFNPAIFVLLIPMAAVLFAGVSLYFKKSNVSESAQFPYSAYIADSNSLAGNVYSLKAQIDSQLAFDENVGRVICVNLDGGESVALLLPTNVARTIHPGQKYSFKVEVLPTGAIQVLNLEKF